MLKIKIPDWAYDVSLAICKERDKNFRNQFITQKLKNAVSDDPILVKYVEGVIGYIGDICGAIFLGLDAKSELRSMIIDTNLLSHRDKYDILFRNHRIDIKTDVVPSDSLFSIINREITDNKAYACRLINKTQFIENSSNVDIYFWGLLSEPDPRKAEFWYPSGFLSKEECKIICPTPLDNLWGRKLHTPAYIFPTSKLQSPEDILSISKGIHTPNNQLVNFDETGYKVLLEKIGL